MAGKVFVTVGSTSFEELISTVCSSNVLDLLKLKGIESITLQTGKVSYDPPTYPGIQIESYDFKNDLSKDLTSATLVISHAGAGSILQALQKQKPLIVVVNDKLMNNHQEELAKELSECKYLKYCYPSKLGETIMNFNPDELVLYRPADPDKFLNYFDQVMGYA